MGQQHQIYVVIKKDNKYQAIGAFHHQWCYGLTAASNCARLATAIEKAKVASKSWSDYKLSDEREADVIVKAIYGLDLNGCVSMVHNETEHLIKNGTARPELGDNNDGCSLVVIDNDVKEVRACLFTPHGLECSENAKYKKWTAYSPREYFEFYYPGKDAVEMLKGNAAQAVALAHKAHPVGQSEFTKIFKASINVRKPRGGGAK